MLRNSYGGLITNGLCLPACCGMITMHFSLFKCKVEIVEPPTGGGGGGGFATGPGYYAVPATTSNLCTKYVIIDIKFTKKYQWRKHYVVDCEKADGIVKVFNFVNTMKSKTRVGIDKIKQSRRAVTAVFKNVSSDK